MKQYLLFEMAGNKYAIETADIVKVISMRPITMLPNTPSEIRGIIKVEERIIVVGDMRQRWHHKVPEESLQTSIMIVLLNEEWIGWVVDAVDQVVYFEDKEILPIQWGKIIRGKPLIDEAVHYEKQLVGILSLKKLMQFYKQD